MTSQIPSINIGLAPRTNPRFVGARRSLLPAREWITAQGPIGAALAIVGLTGMLIMRFGQIEIDPAVSPAILDTATWDAERAWRTICSVGEPYWCSARQALTSGCAMPAHESCTVFRGSYARHGQSVFFLVQLPDSQCVFVEIAAECGSNCLGKPLQMVPIGGVMILAMYGADSITISRYVSCLRPDKGPTAMGGVPRLGIGSRMTTAVWPGVWRAMDRCGFCANAIQNSVRELNLLEDVLAARPARNNYLYGFGALEEGHTGSTFEGLWVAGVIEALKTDTHPKYGADADHITVRRGPDGINRAKNVIDAARNYTFFTLDVSDIVDYGVGACFSADARALVHKYSQALDVVDELSAHINRLKGDVAFDLELSIDECPGDVDAFACLTTEAELTFLALELRRRGIGITHIAPNVGIVKGQDYTGLGVLSRLENRIKGLCNVASEHGVMLDFHSGDDLRSDVRQVIGRATKGRNHFKLSPSLQIIFAEALYDLHPERFEVWWHDTLEYARREASAGSEFAAQCLRLYEDGADRAPSPRHTVFHHYCFASVGKRDANGRFVHRERFYDLPVGFYREYHDRIELFLCEVAQDVLCDAGALG